MNPTAAYLGDYWAVARNHWRLIVASTLVGLLAGLALFAIAPKTYSATASVLVSPVGADTGPVENGRTTTRVNLDTEAQIATSYEVAELIAAKTGSGQTAKETASDLSVTVPPNTAVLNLTFDASSADDAQRGAQAAADAYLENRTQVEKDFIQAQSQQLENRAKELNAQLNELRKQGDQPEAVAGRSVVSANLATLQDQQQQLQSETINPGRIIQAPALPDGPVAPKRTVLAASGALIGLLVGLILAVRREKALEIVSGPQDLERAVGHRSITVIRQDGGGDSEVDTGVRRIALDLLKERGQARYATVAILGLGDDSPGNFLTALGSALGRLGVTSSRTRRGSDTGLDSTPSAISAITLVEADERTGLLDKMETSRLADTSLVVVRLGSTRVDQLRDLMEELDAHQIPVVDIVGLPGDRKAARESPERVG